MNTEVNVGIEVHTRVAIKSILAKEHAARLRVTRPSGRLVHTDREHNHLLAKVADIHQRLFEFNSEVWREH